MYCACLYQFGASIELTPTSMVKSLHSRSAISKDNSEKYDDFAAQLKSIQYQLLDLVKIQE